MILLTPETTVSSPRASLLVFSTAVPRVRLLSPSSMKGFSSSSLMGGPNTGAGIGAAVSSLELLLTVVVSSVYKAVLIEDMCRFVCQRLLVGLLT